MFYKDIMDDVDKNMFDWVSDCPECGEYFYKSVGLRETMASKNIEDFLPITENDRLISFDFYRSSGWITVLKDNVDYSLKVHFNSFEEMLKLLTDPVDAIDYHT